MCYKGVGKGFQGAWNYQPNTRNYQSERGKMASGANKRRFFNSKNAQILRCTAAANDTACNFGYDCCHLQPVGLDDGKCNGVVS